MAFLLEFVFLVACIYKVSIAIRTIFVSRAFFPSALHVWRAYIVTLYVLLFEIIY